jgi:hypothetical protein
MSQVDHTFIVTKHNGVSTNTVDGTIELDYTQAQPTDPITNASFNYQHDDHPDQGPYSLSFTGPDSSGNYTSPCSMSNPLNVPHFGEYKSGSVVFNPTTTALSGTFSSNASLPGDDSISWDASTSMGETEHHEKHHHHKHGAH